MDNSPRLAWEPSMRQNRSKKTFTFEGLERRQMLAGDLVANLANGILTLSGDNSDNAVVITNNSPEVIELIGLARSGESTTINGKSSVLFQGVTNIVVNFTQGRTGVNTGNDAVVITGLELDGSVSIHTGNGDDFIGVGNFDNSEMRVDPAVDTLLMNVTLGKGLFIEMEGGHN